MPSSPQEETQSVWAKSSKASLPIDHDHDQKGRHGISQMAPTSNRAQTWTPDEEHLLLSLLKSSATDPSSKGSPLSWAEIAFEMNKHTMPHLTGTRIFTDSQAQEHYLDVLEPRLVEEEEAQQQQRQQKARLTPAAAAAAADDDLHRRRTLPRPQSHVARTTPSDTLCEATAQMGPPLRFEDYQRRERKASSSPSPSPSSSPS